MTRIAQPSMFVLALAATCLGAAQAPPAERSAEELRGQFKQLYLSLDTRGMESALTELAARFPQEAERSKLEFELGRLYAYSTFGKPDLMYEEGHRAEQILRQFLPSGRFAAAPEAAQAQLEYAWFLLKNGRTEQSRSLYGALAYQQDPTVFTRAAMDYTANFDVGADPADLDFWLGKTEAMAETVKALPPQEQGDLPKQLKYHIGLLRALRDGTDALYALMNQARLHSRQADVAIGYGNHAKVIEKLQKADALATQYLEKRPKTPGKRPKEVEKRLMSVKVMLARAKLWLDQPHEARALLDDVLAHSEALLLGDEPNLYGMALLWSVWTDRYLGLPPQTQEARVLDVLASGYLDSVNAYHAMERLSELAQQRGDMNAARAYLNDMAEFLPDPAGALKAQRARERFEREHPETKSAPAGLRSEGLSRLISAGMVQPLEDVGRVAIFTRDEPDGRRPTFTWVKQMP